MIGDNILEGVILHHQIGHVAEIAILANVFELADTREAAQRFVEPGQYAQASDAAEGSELKLIYYSNDVRRHQTLNFSNIPLLTRREYSGHSVAIQIVVIEIDAESAPMTRLLQTLARFGQQSLPSIPGAHDVLSGLGEALFSGTSQDDVLLDYRFVLSAPGVDPHAVQPTLAPGRYVLRRSENRVVPMTWQNLVLDHNTGRLYRHLPASGAIRDSYVEERNDLYLTLNIRQYPPGTPTEYYAFQDWHTFRDAMAQAADPHAGAIDTVTNNVSHLLAGRRSTELRSGLSVDWAAVEARLQRLSKLDLPADLDTTHAACALLPKAQRDRMAQLAELDAREAIRAFLTDYAAALRPIPPPAGAPAGAPAKFEISDGDREALVSALVRYFLPWPASGADARFASAATFEQAFVTGGGTAFADFAVQTAKGAEHKEPLGTGCEELINRGVATPRPTAEHAG